MYEKHLFICTNGDENTPQKCAGKGSLKLLQDLKSRPLPSAKWRITKSGCLGYCEKGICAVIYPQGTWFFHLKVEEADSLWSAFVQTPSSTP